MVEKSINIVELDNAVATLNHLPLPADLIEAINDVRGLSPGGMLTKSFGEPPKRPTKNDIEKTIHKLETRLEHVETKYQQPVFQCLQDYKKCCQESNKVTCATLMLICLANQFVSIKIDYSNNSDTGSE